VWNWLPPWCRAWLPAYGAGEGLNGRLDCGTQGVKDAVSTDRLRGLRIFDISYIANPKYVANEPGIAHPHFAYSTTRLFNLNPPLFSDGALFVPVARFRSGVSGRPISTLSSYHVSNTHLTDSAMRVHGVAHRTIGNIHLSMGGRGAFPR
jgi:hypothetical protein